MNGWIAIKIDLEKAYNKLKWGFVHDTLEDIRVPSEFIELVWHCISSPSIKVLRNGEDLDRFTASYGIR